MTALPTRLRALLRRAPKPSAPAPSRDDALAAADPSDRPIIERAVEHSMTGVPRLQALVDAVRYCERREIPGAFVECGVWLGGSVLAMILTLQELGVEDRDVYLFDTFEGMTEPSAQDRSPEFSAEMFDPSFFNEEAVRRNVLSSGYPAERVHFVRGPVEETVPQGAPAEIALLRLDTDWYESTRHELEHLYPRLARSGVLIVDDYGHYEGARLAVDEYFDAHGPVLLNRIDYTGRIAVKS